MTEFEALSNTISILMYIGPTIPPAGAPPPLPADAQDFIDLFEGNDKRFLIQMFTRLDIGITERMRDAIIAIIQMTRDAPQVYIP